MAYFDRADFKIFHNLVVISCRPEKKLLQIRLVNSGRHAPCLLSPFSAVRSRVHR
jgi:hypothetical protein